MGIDFLAHCEVVEQCYEFLLGYAAQGLLTDDGNPTGRELRKHLQQARQALIGLPEACKAAIADERLEPAATHEAFCCVLQRDASNARAAIDLVLAQPSLSSQLIDNLNASTHLRALLTDVFLFGEVLRERQKITPAAKGQ
jgi:hypothetical protein